MIHESKHPLVKSLVHHLRDISIDALQFRQTVADLTRFMLYEALGSSDTVSKEIDTWNGKFTGDFIDEQNIIFVTILRAGLPMLEAANTLFPNAPSGFLAMKRDEVTKKSVLYYERIPDCKGKTVMLVDVMVATGGSLCDAIDLIKYKNADKIVALAIIGSPEGLGMLSQKHHDIDIFIAQIDHSLNSEKFIIPGLGDAGDRSYNTL
jgi:uracil phosphoribosyltransferase